MRGRFGTGAVALWSFALNVALTKGWLDWCPDWGVAMMLGIPIMTWAYIGLTHDTVRNYLKRTRPVVAIAVFILVGAVIGGAGGGVIYALLRRSHDSQLASTAPTVTPRKDDEQKPFIIDYRPGNCGFFTVDAPSSNHHLNGRKGVYVADITVVNNTGGSTTLKEVMLAYDHKGEKREVLGNVMPVGKLKTGESALMLFWGADKLMMIDWYDIRRAIAENKEKVPGAIWRGSSTFILEPDIKSVSDVGNPRLVARDYLGKVAERPISPVNMSDWNIRFEPFVQEADDSIRWENEPIAKSSSPPAPQPKVEEKKVPQNVVGTELQRELSALYKGRTAVKVMELIEPYKGRLIEVQGRVEQVNSTPPALYHVILSNSPDIGCVCFFDSAWKEKLLSLEQGSVVKIRGKFAPDQNGGIIVMRECELVSTTPP